MSLLSPTSFQLTQKFLLCLPDCCLSGAGPARFEPSTSLQHSGQRVVYLRITKVLHLTKLEPTFARWKSRIDLEAGQLLHCSSAYPDGEAKPWMHNIEGSNIPLSAALCALWDNCEIVCLASFYSSELSSFR
jgi:hypothetical protein